MKTVVLFGDQQEEYYSLFAGELKKYHLVHSLFPGFVGKQGNEDSPPLLLAGKNEDLTVNCPCVLIFTHNETPFVIQTSQSVISIVEEGNERALSMLRQGRQVVVSCGMGQKSSVSIASFSEDSAVVSVQRQLISLDGDVIEPHDLKISLSRPLSEFALMSMCVSLLLIGHRRDDDCYEI